MVAAGPDEPKRSTYIALFLTTLSLLQFELFLTRIFSVTMWYHFAFMAISLAMFGLAAGAIFIELMKRCEAPAMLANFGLHRGRFTPLHQLDENRPGSETKHRQ